MGKSKGLRQSEEHFRKEQRKKRIIERLPWGKWYGGPYDFYRKFYLDCPKCGTEGLLDVQQSGNSRTGFHCLDCDHWQNKYQCAYCDHELHAPHFYGYLDLGPCCTQCVRTKNVGLRIGYKVKGRFYEIAK